GHAERTAGGGKMMQGRAALSQADAVRLRDRQHIAVSPQATPCIGRGPGAPLAQRVVVDHSEVAARDRTARGAILCIVVRGIADAAALALQGDDAGHQTTLSSVPLSMNESTPSLVTTSVSSTCSPPKPIS